MKKYKPSEFPNMVCYKQHEVESLSALTDAQAGLAFKVLGSEAYNLPKPEVKDPIVLAFLPLLREGVIGRLNNSREQSKKGKSGGKKSAENRKKQAEGQAEGQAISISTSIKNKTKLDDDDGVSNLRDNTTTSSSPFPPSTIPTKEEVEAYAKERGVDVKWVDSWYGFESDGGWKDKNGKQIYSWKQRLLCYWRAEKTRRSKASQPAGVVYHQNGYDSSFLNGEDYHPKSTIQGRPNGHREPGFAASLGF